MVRLAAHTIAAVLVSTMAVAVAAAQSADGENPAQQGESVAEQYRAVVAQAIRDYGLGHWQRARDGFLAAHELMPSARTFRTLGMTSFALEQYAQAVDELRAALADTRRPLDEALVGEVEALIEKALTRVGRIELRWEPEGAGAVDPAVCLEGLQVDGADPVFGRQGALLLDPGEHRLTVECEGWLPAEQAARVRAGQNDSVRLALVSDAPEPEPVMPTPEPSMGPTITPAPGPEPPSPPAPVEPAPHRARRWAWGSAGAAGLLAVGAITARLLARGEYDSLKQRCAAVEGCVQGDPERDVDDARLGALETTSTMLFAAAAAAATSATISLWIERRRAHVRLEASATRLRLSVRY